jgi:hypothetical protein
MIARPMTSEHGEVASSWERRHLAGIFMPLKPRQSRPILESDDFSL